MPRLPTIFSLTLAIILEVARGTSFAYARQTSDTGEAEPRVELEAEGRPPPVSGAALPDAKADADDASETPSDEDAPPTDGAEPAPEAQRRVDAAEASTDAGRGAGGVEGDDGGDEPAGPRAGAGDEPLRYVLEGIEVEGNTRTNARVILRYLPFRPGDVIDVDDPVVENARYRLLGTGFFRDVGFRLVKGSGPGRVVLVVRVEERNTIIVNGLWLGIASSRDEAGVERPVTAFGGVDVAETNLAGTGITLGSALALSAGQLALKVRFLEPAFLGSAWMIAGDVLYNDGLSFFGNGAVSWDDPRLDEVATQAVVDYTRFGGSLGLGRDIGVNSQVWTYYRLETANALLPRAASHEYGGEREPIDFHILPGQSILSALRGTFQYDSRDHPVFPTRGWLTTVTGEVALPAIGSDYSFQKLEVGATAWWVPWREHVLSFSVFGGAIAGSAPFFEQYFVGDFSDFRPSRVLGLTFDHRPAPNLLDTAIAEVQYANYAAKINTEYRIPLFRGFRSIYGIDFFVSGGVFAMANDREFQRPPSNRSGAALIPMDLTANVGFRMDTKVGGFQFAFSNVLGFVPPLNPGGQ